MSQQYCCWLAAALLVCFSISACFASERYDARMREEIVSGFGRTPTSEVLVRLSRYVTDSEEAVIADDLESRGCSVSSMSYVGNKQLFRGFLLKDFNNCNVTMPEIRALSGVIAVAPNAIVSVDNHIWQNYQFTAVSLGLKRISSAHYPLDQSYGYDYTGQGVDVYVLDTGVRTTHDQFTENRAETIGDRFPTCSGPDAVGHGTHVAGIIAGAYTGVAKDVRIKSYRVIDCDSSTSTSDIIEALNEVRQMIHTSNRRAVINLSLGSVSRSQNEVFDNVVQDAISEGIVVVKAAGNNGDDACFYDVNGASQASYVVVTGASAVKENLQQDRVAVFSNVGECVSLFAPGVAIRSAYANSNSAYATASGTSMAAPHVSGAAALYLEAHPTASVAEVYTALRTHSLSGSLTDISAGSPNLLLQTHFGENGPAAVEPLPIACLGAARCSLVPFGDMDDHVVGGSSSGVVTSTLGVDGFTYFFAPLAGATVELVVRGPDALDLDVSLQQEMCFTETLCVWASKGQSASITSQEKVIDTVSSGWHRIRLWTNCAGNTCPIGASFELYVNYGYDLSPEYIGDFCESAPEYSGKMTAKQLGEYAVGVCYAFRPVYGVTYTFVVETSAGSGSCGSPTRLQVLRYGSSGRAETSEAIMVAESSDTMDGACPTLQFALTPEEHDYHAEYSLCMSLERQSLYTPLEVVEPLVVAWNASLGTSQDVSTVCRVGCIDPRADNFDSDATVPSQACLYSGCTDPGAYNFNSLANVDSGECLLPSTFVTEDKALVSVSSAAYPDAILAVEPALVAREQYSEHCRRRCDETPGCVALNLDNAFRGLRYCTLMSVNHRLPGVGVYRARGSSMYIYKAIHGCLDRRSPAYSPLATVSNSTSCGISGCMNTNATNYDPTATYDNGSCTIVNSDGTQLRPGCMDAAAANYDASATVSQPETCLFKGCTHTRAYNYDVSANVDDGSCVTPIRIRRFQNRALVIDEADIVGTSVAFESTDCRTLCDQSPSCISMHSRPIPANSSAAAELPQLSEYTAAELAQMTVYECEKVGWNHRSRALQRAPGTTYYYKIISGCPNVLSERYNPHTIWRRHTMCHDVDGCTNVLARNYDPLATVEDGSCDFSQMA